MIEMKLDVNKIALKWMKEKVWVSDVIIINNGNEMVICDNCFGETKDYYYIEFKIDIAEIIVDVRLCFDCIEKLKTYKKQK